MIGDTMETDIGSAVVAGMRSSPRAGAVRRSWRYAHPELGGFWEPDNFDPLLVHMKAFCRTIGREFAGALLRPCGETFRGLLELNRPVKDILEAAEAAGRQLAQEGKMSPEVLNTVSREITPLDRFMTTSNKICRQYLDALEEKK